MRPFRYLRSPEHLIVGILALTLISALSLSTLLMLRTKSPVLRQELGVERHQGPPWIYGHAGARFGMMEYADLECPYCRDYFDVLRRWISVHPDVYWEWHFLPLASHEPAASAEARLVECVGEISGNQAFWSTVEWIYRNTRGNGEGVPADAKWPAMSTHLQECSRSPRVMSLIRNEVSAALSAQITATPTVRLLDRHTGKTIILQGVLEDDALSSALDLLSSPPERLSDSAAQPGH
jgi:protein-disulfide isomerase